MLLILWPESWLHKLLVIHSSVKVQIMVYGVGWLLDVLWFYACS